MIIHVFPEYTPHDATSHLEQLFALADRILGAELYARLNLAEMTLLVFGLYAHDWGMAVSNDDRDAISGHRVAQDTVLIPHRRAPSRRFEARKRGSGKRIIKIYLRRTHAHRSGWRLRKELKPLGYSFAEMVARVAEGHGLDFRELRDPEPPLCRQVLGQGRSLRKLPEW